MRPQSIPINQQGQPVHAVVVEPHTSINVITDPLPNDQQSPLKKAN